MQGKPLLTAWRSMELVINALLLSRLKLPVKSVRYSFLYANHFNYELGQATKVKNPLILANTLSNGPFPYSFPILIIDSI